MDVDLIMMMVDYTSSCRIYAVAPGAGDVLMMCRSGGASVESLQSWGAALYKFFYAMAPGSRLHESHWRCQWRPGEAFRR